MDGLTRSGISAWMLASATLAALVVLVMSGFGLNRAAPLAGAISPMSGTLVHWRDASHDWLLIGDGKSDQLNIYNAVDGSLIRRVAVRRGLSNGNALAQRDGRLFVVGEDGKLDELTLPQLQMVAVNGP